MKILVEYLVPSSGIEVLQKKRKLTLEKTFIELTLKADLDDENDYQSTLDAEKLIIKYGTPDHLKVIMSIKTNHYKLGQLGKTDRKIRDCLYQKYLHSMKAVVTNPSISCEDLGTSYGNLTEKDPRTHEVIPNYKESIEYKEFLRYQKSTLASPAETPSSRE